MRRYLLYFLLFCSLIFSVSCNKDKLKAPTASFLVVNNVTLKTNYANQGSTSHKITDIWYYVNDQFKGVFPIGGVMPIVASGKVEIKLLAGIKNNGISSTRVTYPAYNFVTYTLSVEAGKTYTINPEFEYNSTAFFHFKEDFDGVAGSGNTFTLAHSSTDSISLNIKLNPTLAFEGGGCIYMSMNDAKPTAEIITNSNYYLPGGGATVYVELNYKCNQSFVVGVVGSNVYNATGTDTREAVTVNPSREWSKIYVQLSSIVGAPPVNQYFKIFIRAFKQKEHPEIYIDNVKLIIQ